VRRRGVFAQRAGTLPGRARPWGASLGGVGRTAEEPAHFPGGTGMVPPSSTPENGPAGSLEVWGHADGRPGWPPVKALTAKGSLEE
jgi:hypothetical protein